MSGFNSGVQLIELKLNSREILPHAADISHVQLFCFPLFSEAGQFAFFFFHFSPHFSQPLLYAVVVFTFQLASRQFQLRETSLHGVDFLRHAIQFHRQFAGGFIDQVNRFIR